MKKLLKKKAFTLIELIVALAVSFILIIGAISMFRPVQRIIGGMEENIIVNNVTDSLMTFISDRLGRSATYNIGAYTTTQLIDMANGPYHRYDVMSSVTDSDAVTSKMYCMALKKHTDGGYRLYDLGDVSLPEQMAQKLMKVYDKLIVSDEIDEYALYEDEYYGIAHHKFKFETTFDPNGAAWCNIGVQTTDENGDIITSERSQMFRLLNMSVSDKPAADDEVLKDYTYSDDSIIIIIYKINNYVS